MPATQFSTGVSIVICCHNSAARLPRMLPYLRAQEVPGGLCWEVVVVDNASTDGTAQIARELWPANMKVPLRIVDEPRLGLSFARQTGFKEARYEYVSFLDDDNWAAPSWVRTVNEVMTRHGEVGACGGYSEAVFESEPPSWFENHKTYYAVGPDWGDPASPSYRDLLWGAGLTIRKSAWQQLVDNGFSSRLIGRQGTRLLAGEDTELCLALRLNGWRLYYDPRLRLRHYMCAARLQWSHLRKLYRGDGEASVDLDAYGFALAANDASLKSRLKMTWQWQALAVIKRLAGQPSKSLTALYGLAEGDSGAAWVENQTGRLVRLLQLRGKYNSSVHQMQSFMLNKRWDEFSVAQLKRKVT